MAWSCYAKRDEPETNPPSVAAHAPQPPPTTTPAAPQPPLVAAHAPQHEGGDESPPAKRMKIMQQGDLPPGIPPGYPARPKRQAEFPWREAQHASPIAPPLVSRISSTMAGLLNISPPPPAITSASQQARPSIAPRVMPPPPAVVPATRKAEIPSAVPTQAPSTRTTGPNRYSGGCRRNWEKQLGYATRKGQEAREEFLKRYGSWYPNSREDDDEFLLQYKRDNEGVYIRCA